jgi:phospholipase/lecithinase/hemolysin
MPRTHIMLLAVSCGVAFTFASAASAQIAGVGVMGDSLSDEYAEGDYSYAKNWVQQFVIARGIDFGPTAEEADQPGGTWGEPRRTQYELNWARSGADSVTLLSQGQHTGLASQIQPYGISHAVLAIGANDFAPVPLPGYAYWNIYWGFWSNAQKQQYINDVASRIATAMDTVLDEGVQLVLANVPDYGVTPIARSLFPNASRRQNVTVVIAQLNDLIENLAAQREIVLIDVSAIATAIFGTNFEQNDILLIGNVEIYVTESDNEANEFPQSGFVHDDIHPHTTLQGIFANVILEAMNLAYGGNTALLSDAEILAIAGIAYGGAETLTDEIGEFAEYVRDYTGDPPCLPADLNCDGFVNVADLLIMFDQWGSCSDPNDCPADLNGDGTVNVADLLILFDNWG